MGMSSPREVGLCTGPSKERQSDIQLQNNFIVPALFFFLHFSLPLVKTGAITWLLFTLLGDKKPRSQWWKCLVHGDGQSLELIWGWSLSPLPQLRLVENQLVGENVVANFLPYRICFYFFSPVSLSGGPGLLELECKGLEEERYGSRKGLTWLVLYETGLVLSRFDHRF